jgi:hypothetical protein
MRPLDSLDTRELGGADALDVQPARQYSRFHVRAALGLRPTIAPALLFIPLGAMLGPSGAGVLSREVLAHLSPIVSVSLVVLGIFIGLAIGRRRPTRRLVIAAAIEAGVTMGVVSASVLYLLRTWGLDLDLSPMLVAIALGIVSSVSSAPASTQDAQGALAASIADFDDVLPVVAGAVVLLFVHPRGMEAAIALGIWAMVFAAIIAVAADLLFRSATRPERNAFLAGAIALVAGGAAFVGGAPLLAGFVTGMVWSRLQSSAAAVAENFGRLQHPFMVAMLLIAGAVVDFTMLAVWLTIPVVLFRLAGKLLGASVSGRVVSSGTTADLGAALIAPGLIGVAFALQLAQVTGSAGVAIASAAAIATVVNEVLGALVAPEPREA